MTDIRNLYFIAVSALILIAPSLCRHLEALPAESYLEGSKRPEMPRLAWGAVRTGEAQSAFDAALAFGVPRRDEAMLAHARLQRGMIAFAARLFGFDVWPTYYGSQHCHVASADAIAEIPLTASPEQEKRFASAARSFVEIMNASPEARFFFALVDEPTSSSAGPLHSLVGAPVDYAYVREHFLAHLPKTCTVIDLGYAKGDDFYHDYFRTDHHWRIQGAVRAYGKIASALGIVPVKFNAPAPATAAEFFGSRSRQGLDADVAGDAIYDVAYKRSPLLVEVNGKEASESFIDFGYSGLSYKQNHKFEDMYNGYFPSWPELHLRNERVTSGVLLIVGNSYVQCMERFFAESYRDVYKLASPLAMTKFLASHQVDDILFLFSPSLL